MGYVYRGDKHDVDTPPRTNKHHGFDPSACGTYAGYRRHQKWGVPACQDCKDAQAAYSRDYWHHRGTRPTRIDVFDPSACGTHAGYRRHTRSDVPPCRACLTAYADYMHHYRAKKAAV